MSVQRINVYEDATVIIWEETGAGWTGRSFEWKPGSEPYNERQMHDKLVSALAAVETAAETKAAWDALTAAQRQEANRRAALAACKLIRLILGRLGSN